MTATSFGRELARNKTIARALINEQLARWRHHVKGTVVDLASGRDAGYRRLWASESATIWVSADLSAAGRPTVITDLRSRLPFAPGCADIVILASFLYIAPDPVNVLAEIKRILKPSGSLIVTTPLVFPPMPEPDDYWRFTEQGLEHLLSKAGYAAWDIVGVGDRWTSAAYLIEPFLRPRRLLLYPVGMVCRWLDRLTTALRGRSLPSCPVAYCVLASAEGSEER